VSTQPSQYEREPELPLDESVEELYEMAPCGYFTTTIDGRIVKVNKTFTEWLGYEREELLDGTRFVDLLTAGGKIFYETHLRLLLRTQRTVDEIALDIVCKNGRVLPTLLNARQKRNAAGEPLLNRFTVFNASERRMYERQLLAARDLFRTTLSSIGDGVVATDADERITFMNPVAEQLSGWSSDEAMGRQIDDVLVFRREGGSPGVEKPIAQALKQGAIIGMRSHTVLTSRDGRTLPVDDSAAPIRDVNGEVVGGVIVFRDISPQRKTERALLAAHDQLKRTADELRRSNEDLSQFAHVASHDLRSPLRTVTVYAQLLQHRHGDKLGDDGQELLGYLTSGASRMAGLIEDLLAYARVSEAPVEAAAPVDANVELRTAVENLQALIGKSGATITTDPLPEVPIDKTQLVQIFQNLIGNAIHYRGTEPPAIHISAEQQGEQWRFSCRDNGLGIEPEYQAQIFEPFKRLHGSERPGSGIGLAVCNRIVQRNKGTIWVESDGAHGSTFYFTLPAV
jgi:PAS domain S-box-containing protein